FPSLVAELARPGNCIEAPDLFPGPHIEGAHQPFRVVVGGNSCAFTHRRTHKHNILDDDRSRVDADLSGFQIDLLIHSFDDADFQIDHAVLTERWDHCAVFCIERDEPVTGRYVQNAIVASAVGPVSDAAARKLPRSDSGTLAFAKAVCPDQLTCL